MSKEYLIISIACYKKILLVAVILLSAVQLDKEILPAESRDTGTT